MADMTAAQALMFEQGKAIIDAAISEAADAVAAGILDELRAARITVTDSHGATVEAVPWSMVQAVCDPEGTLRGTS